MTIDERLDRLTGVAETLAGRVASHDSTIDALTTAAMALNANVAQHDRQIGALLALAEKEAAEMAALRKSQADLDRRWQAYLNTLKKQ